MTAVRKPATDRRRALYGKIEIACKDLGLDDDTFRDLMERQTGKRSRTKLSDSQLIDLVEHFKTLGFKPVRKAPARAGKRPLADGVQAKKIRALWISGYNLGVIKDPSEKALGAFAKRVTGGRESGTDALQWLDSAGAFKVIEALKDWLARDAGVNWSAYAVANATPVYMPRSRVAEAQWRKLAKLGAVDVASNQALHSFACGMLRPGRAQGFSHFSPADQDKVIARLGDMIRKAMAG